MITSRDAVAKLLKLAVELLETSSDAPVLKPVPSLCWFQGPPRLPGWYVVEIRENNTNQGAGFLITEIVEGMISHLSSPILRHFRFEP